MSQRTRLPPTFCVPCTKHIAEISTHHLRCVHSASKTKPQKIKNSPRGLLYLSNPLFTSHHPLLLARNELFKNNAPYAFRRRPQYRIHLLSQGSFMRRRRLFHLSSLLPQSSSNLLPLPRSSSHPSHPTLPSSLRLLPTSQPPNPPPVLLPRPTLLPSHLHLRFKSPRFVA